MQPRVQAATPYALSSATRCTRASGLSSAAAGRASSSCKSGAGRRSGGEGGRGRGGKGRSFPRARGGGVLTHPANRRCVRTHRVLVKYEAVRQCFLVGRRSRRRGKVVGQLARHTPRHPTPPPPPPPSSPRPRCAAPRARPPSRPLDLLLLEAVADRGARSRRHGTCSPS